MSYTGDEDADMQHFYKLLEKEINLMKQNVSFAKLEWKYQQDLFKAKFRELQQDKARWNIGRKLEQQEKMKFQFQQQLKVLQTKEMQSRYEDYFERERDMTEFRKSLGRFDSTISLVAGNVFGRGTMIASVFTGAAQAAKALGDTHNLLDRRQQKLAEAFEEAQRLIGQGDKEGAEAAQKKFSNIQNTINELRERVISKFGEAQVGGKTVGTWASDLGKFAKKHWKGITIATASLVALKYAYGEALKASPMLQQMHNLWDYAIKMIWRPIGDFFGFLFRPILILLLRKFIIPWYQTMQPVLVALGGFLGNTIAGIMDFFTSFEQGGLILLFKQALGLEPEEGILTAYVIPWIASLFGYDAEKVREISKELVANSVEWLKSFFLNSFDFSTIDITGYWNDLTGFFKNISDAVKEGSGWVTTRWDDFTKFFSILQSDVLGWVKDRYDDFVDFIANTLGGVWTAVSKGWNAFMSFWGAIGNAFPMILRMIGLGGLIGDEKTHYTGGIISEPIHGVGASGRMYSFGERGAEVITPLSGYSRGSGGANIVINIGTMSASDSDLQKLRKTILDVMHETNSYRGRM